MTGLPVPQDRQWHREILCDGWRQEWFRRYVEEGHFQHDPCVARCRHRAFPFLWSDLQFEPMSPRAKLVMDEARAFAMKDGLCVPIHIPFRGPAVVTAAGERLELSQVARPLVEVLCVKAFQTICRLEGLLDVECGPILGPREAEVLQWNAAGKTAEEIGIILNVSTFTVQSHLRHIREKLGANNVSRAVSKAIVLGEIQAGNDKIWR
ncbi:autoinducer binding domain-containing protein [Hoeflea sp. 108]|uniref:autoinducer binding domain-containing protein n=1 Tax=Hoeflea sp. 108 TaxID=1116369 RepID=UPI001FDA57A6|nr:autoinducer binding domain-containing protein [Hoeflea sp. 108]MCX8570859.1 autoinducer binding domain-containing protein [Aminobacter sp. MET-1]